jgi:hypothetical protein
MKYCPKNINGLIKMIERDLEMITSKAWKDVNTDKEYNLGQEIAYGNVLWHLKRILDKEVVTRGDWVDGKWVDDIGSIYGEEVA